MGARINFIFKQSDGNAVGLYSHWGEYSWAEDLAAALKHAGKRIGDEPYYIRMVISHLIKDNVLDETGYGIFACNPDELAFMDMPIVIDLTNNTVNDITGTHSIKSFIDYHSLNAATAG